MKTTKKHIKQYIRRKALKTNRKLSSYTAFKNGDIRKAAFLGMIKNPRHKINFVMGITIYILKQADTVYQRHLKPKIVICVRQMNMDELKMNFISFYSPTYNLRLKLFNEITEKYTLLKDPRYD